MNQDQIKIDTRRLADLLRIDRMSRSRAAALMDALRADAALAAEALASRPRARVADVSDFVRTLKARLPDATVDELYAIENEDWDAARSESA